MENDKHYDTVVPNEIGSLGLQRVRTGTVGEMVE